MSWLSGILPTCREMTRLISDGMDRSLPFHVRARMHLHLRMCLLCEQYKRQLSLIQQILRKHGDRLIDDDGSQQPALSPEARNRIQDTFDSQQE